MLHSCLVLADARFLFDFRHNPIIDKRFLPSDIILSPHFELKSKGIMFEDEWRQMRPMIKANLVLIDSTPAKPQSFEDCVLQLRNSIYYKHRVQFTTIRLLTDYLQSFNLVDYKVLSRNTAVYEPKLFNQRLLSDRCIAIEAAKNNNENKQ